MEEAKSIEGFVKVPNSLMESIYSMDFNASQMKVLICLIRNTYGYNRIDCEFSNGYVARKVGISKRRVGEVIKSLEDSKVILITKKETFNSAKRVKINDDYKEWNIIAPQWSSFGTDKKSFNSERNVQEVTNASPVDEKVTSGTMRQEVTNMSTDDKSVISTDDERVSRSGDERVTHKIQYINTIYKDNNSVHSANELFERLWKMYPVKRGKGQVSDAKKRKLLEIGLEEMERAINRYKVDLAEQSWRKPQNGSTFFNSGYIDYLDKEWYKTHPQEQEQQKPDTQEELPEQEEELVGDDW